MHYILPASAHKCCLASVNARLQRFRRSLLADERELPRAGLVLHDVALRTTACGADNAAPLWQGGLNIAYSPINRPEDLLQDPHVLRPSGLVQNFNADGAPFRVPALPVEWNGGNIGEGLKVPVLGADTEAVRAELDKQDPTSKINAA